MWLRILEEGPLTESASPAHHWSVEESYRVNEWPLSMLGSVNLLGMYYHAKLYRILYKDEKFMISTDNKGKEYE